jgi:hypothetical protein
VYLTYKNNNNNKNNTKTLYFINLEYTLLYKPIKSINNTFMLLLAHPDQRLQDFLQRGAYNLHVRGPECLMVNAVQDL